MQIIVKEAHSIDYEQRIYLPGERIDLPAKDAKRLIAKGVAELFKTGDRDAKLKTGGRDAKFCVSTVS